MMIKKKYFSWCVVLMMVMLAARIMAQDKPGPIPDAKSDLISILQSAAPKAEKAIACKLLAINGTDKAVPSLAPLLADEELASWARTALEAIPGPDADAALRNALDKLEDRLLIGAINSIGVRRDDRAVDSLVRKLDDANAGVASAAAVALGHIGGEAAAKALAQSLADAPAGVRSAVAQGCILCAEWFLAHDRTDEAVELYDTIRQADVPGQRHLEAIRGAILARRSAGVPLLIEQLQSPDKERLGIGLRTARELPGQRVTISLSSELNHLDPDRRPLLLLAIADRNDSSALSTVKRAALSGSKKLRITAINILIRLGDVSCVPILLEPATGDDVELKKAAMEALIRLPGKDVDAALLIPLPQAGGELKQVLIELAGQRQISEALSSVVSSLQDSNAGIRGAAIQTVGIIGQEPQTVDLVKLLQQTENSGGRSSIEKALLAICGRSGVKCIPHLQPLIKNRDNELYMIGLHALAIVGGPDALKAVNTAIESAEPPVQDEAVRILSTWPNNWPEDSEAGHDLLLLATTAEKITHQVLGLRGYLQYIRGNKKLSNERKVARIKDVWPHIKRTEEKHQAISVLGEAPSASALEMLTPLAEDSAFAEETYTAMVRIADQNESGISRDQRRQVLQTVIKKSGNEGTRRRARRALSGIR